MIQNALDQVGNILSGSSKNLTSDTYGTTGSAEGQAAGQWAQDQYKGMMDPTAYGGPNPYAQGPNPAQQQQFNMLTGMQSGYGAPGGYQDMYKNLSGATPQQIGALNRSGGPGAYQSKYGDAMKGHLKKDYDETLAMMKNRIGSGAAGQNAFGSTRHGVAEGVGGAKAMDDYLSAATRIDADAYDKGMNWMGQDQNREIAIANANNQANLGFGNMRMNAASGDINNQMNMANQFGQYGLNQQDQRNRRGMFDYGEFNRMQNWKPNMMNNYMASVSGTPWQQQTQQTETGSGPSDLQNLIGTGIQAYGTYKMATAGGGGTCIPKGTTIDMADGDKAPIEKIEAGDLVIGMDGRETEVQQIHQYKQTPNAKFVTITFDNGSKVNCSHDHMINNKRARNYILNDKIGSRKVTNVVFYMGVEKSYDIITTTGGYRIEGIPVNTMIPEMAEKSLEQMYRLNKQAA